MFALVLTSGAAQAQDGNATPPAHERPTAPASAPAPAPGAASAPKAAAAPGATPPAASAPGAADSPAAAPGTMPTAPAPSAPADTATVTPSPAPASPETGAAPASSMPDPSTGAAPGSPATPPGYYGRYELPLEQYKEAPPAPSGYHEHDGFFARLSLGAGATVVSYREAVDGQNVSDVNTRGLAILFGASVGGRVYKNLIIHADLVVSAYGAADRTVDGTTDARDRIEGSLSLLGGGATYYFMPGNVYLTGIIGITTYAERRDQEDAVESGVGFGMSTLIGKEWWVGSGGDWAVGGALRASLYTAPLDIAYTESQLGAFDVGLVFDTTFN